MERKKIKKLIKEIKENKNPALILNRALDTEEINWLYKHTKPKHEEGWFYEDGKFVYYGPDGRKYG